MSLSHKSRRYLLARRRQQQRRPRSSCPSSCRALITLRSVRADEREREKTTPSWSVYTVGSWSRPRYKSWLYSASDVIFRREWGRRGGCRLEVWFLFPARAWERERSFSRSAPAPRATRLEVQWMVQCCCCSVASHIRPSSSYAAALSAGSASFRLLCARLVYFLSRTLRLCELLLWRLAVCWTICWMLAV